MYHLIAISLIPGIGPVLARNLVSYCGSAEAVFKVKRSHLLKVPGIGEAVADNIRRFSDFDRVEQELRFIEKNEVQCLTYLDELYPRRLKQCPDAPLLLFSRGNADLNAPRILGVVGTRNATSYGKGICEDLAASLKDENILIVSGMAYGIDIAMHKACVKNNVPTIGVMATGLDRIYPPAHRETANKMMTNGGLLTEFMSDTNPDRQNFPRRNRIVAGMIDGLIVVETGINGGAVITALLADDYHRDVMAFPGQIHHPYSTGCNKLIKSNKAAMVESTEDVLDIMGWSSNTTKTQHVQQQLFHDLNDDEQQIHTILQEYGELYIDDIQSKSQLTPGNLAGVLLSMEFKGLISALPGKRYRLERVAIQM